MKRTMGFISLIVLIVCFTSCSNEQETQTPDIVSAETVVAMFNATVAAAPTIPPTAIPTITITNTAQVEVAPTVPAATDTSVKVLVPLYWEATWESLGRSELEVPLNMEGDERVTLSGYSYQASIPSESIENNADAYYFIDNMKNLGWKFIFGGGSGGTILEEYYNENGYFLMMWSKGGQESPSITVWISDETTVVPVIPTPQSD